MQQYYLRARYYSQSTGRFSQLDPFPGNNFDPQSLHKYAYAHGDPVVGTDPSGMFTLIELLIVIAIIEILVVLLLPNISTSQRRFQGRLRGRWFGNVNEGVKYITNTMPVYEGANSNVPLGSTPLYDPGELHDIATNLPSLHYLCGSQSCSEAVEDQKRSVVTTGLLQRLTNTVLFTAEITQQGAGLTSPHQPWNGLIVVPRSVWNNYNGNLSMLAEQLTSPSFYLPGTGDPRRTNIFWWYLGPGGVAVARFSDAWFGPNSPYLGNSNVGWTFNILEEVRTGE
jgi:hypothetical protein